MKPETNKSHKPGQIRAFFAIAWYSLKAQTRNPATFFFGFIFPVVFISIFGLIGNSNLKINVGLVNEGSSANPIVAAIQKQPSLAIQKGKINDLQTKLIQGKLAGIVIVQSKSASNYDVRVIRSTGFPQESAVLMGIVSGIVDKTNLSLSNVTTPPVSFATEDVSGRKPRYIDFALPGQIGFALLSTALFGTVFGLIYLKKAGILKRMFASPTRPLTILLAQGTSRLFVALAQTVLIVLIGVIAFKFYLPFGIKTFIEIIFISMIGLIAFLGFGYFIAGLSSDENSAGPLTNLVTLPQFLLSGTFFPTSDLPSWIQPIAKNLPLFYFNQAIRHITTEAGSFTETIPYLLGLLVWGTVMYLLAAWTFKWE